MSDPGRRPDDELFDLPVERSLSLFPELDGSPLLRRRPAAPPTPPRETEAAPLEQSLSEVPEEALRPAPLGRRWLGGLADVLLHAVLGLVLIAGARLLGARVEGREVFALALFLTVFSFLYTVYSLAFWGRSPGMARAGLVAKSGEQGALTFGQTALRWLGGLLTLALAGLPSLLALAGGRSLTDLISGTRTYRS